METMFCSEEFVCWTELACLSFGVDAALRTRGARSTLLLFRPDFNHSPSRRCPRRDFDPMDNARLINEHL